MSLRLLKAAKDFLFISVEDVNKKEFQISINSMNVARAKITASIFIILEIVQLAASFIIKGEKLLRKPDLYYGIMYVILLAAMIVFLILIIRMGENIAGHEKGIFIYGIFFMGSILLWCAGISLLDQLSSGQVIVYTVAIICVAVTPVFHPVTLLLVYIPVHTSFLVLLPYFQKSGGLVFSNYINSTTFLIIAYAISYMRYKKQVEDFNNRKIIMEQSEKLRRINIKLEELSQTDSLTGIYNRFMFDRTIKSEWDRCKRQFKPLSLIMVDMDFFKIFNDTYGHRAGDECIRKVAGELLACAKRSSDTVTRYGGEEFAIILPYTEKENAMELAELMRKMVEDLAIPHICSAVSDYVTISVGVNTVIPSDGLSIDEFIDTADKALYKAKNNRNQIVVA